MKRVYLDYASVTPMDKDVSKAMEPYLVGYVGNASSLYKEGVEAKKILEEARGNIGACLDTPRDTVIFTSGGTESNNMVIQGVFELARSKGIANPHFVTTEIEHSSVLKVFSSLERKGAKVSYLKPNECGVVNQHDLDLLMNENTVLVSVMMVNNEIGTIQPIKEIARKVRLYKLEKKSIFPYVHSDASQAVCDMKIAMNSLGLDFLTIDGLKMYGPRGAGILVKKRTAELLPITFGGGQEMGLRSGTEHIANAVGLSAALKKSVELMERETGRMKELEVYFKEQIQTVFKEGECEINGRDSRVGRIINVCLKPNNKHIDAEFWVIALDKEGIACSFVSSCQNINEDSSSYVLKSLGKEECSSSSIRFSFGRETTKKDIDVLTKALSKIKTYA